MQQNLSPNQYEIRGPGLTISYSQSGIAGQAQLTMTKGRRALTFSGSAIAEHETPIGQLISVQVSAVPDKSSTLFSFLLPAIQLPASHKQSFRTLGVTTVQETSIGGPRKPVEQTYKSVQLRGVARQVQSFGKHAAKA